MLNQKVLLIGGGSMGRSLLRGILKAGLTDAAHMTVVDIHEERLKSLHEEFGIEVSTDSAAAVQGKDVIILAVKPFSLNDVLDAIREHVEPRQLFISIIAGIECAYIRDRLRRNNPVIRCMPNIAATVDAAASAIAACPPASREHVDVALAIFSAVGIAIQVDEHLMDAVTGLSGSGPAYVYMVIEALCDGGVKMGLPATSR